MKKESVMYIRTNIFCYIIIIYFFNLQAGTQYLIKQLCLSAPITKQQEEYLSTLNHVSLPKIILKELMNNIPLFNYYPSLAYKIPYISLGNYPTPIYSCSNQFYVDHNMQLYIKDENVSGRILSNGTKLCGGNKVRKLEFALADAIKQGCSTTMTFGPVGSNHALATTMYARLLGLDNICLLSPQPKSEIVQRNLLLQKYYDADLYFFTSRKEREEAAFNQFQMYYSLHKNFPYVIPAGASYPLGTVGFVNAAFELSEQIQADLMPLPDVIYVAAGSLGTFAGLLLGCKAVGLPTKVIGVAIEPDINNLKIQKTLSLVKATNEYLHMHDNSFPLFDWQDDDIIITMDFSGPSYGIYTTQTEEAIEFLKNTAQITLDYVYSGKAFCAVLNHINSGFLDNKKVLFWNTFCSHDFGNIIKTVDYKTLKPEFHCYFEY